MKEGKYFKGNEEESAQQQSHSSFVFHSNKNPSCSNGVSWEHGKSSVNTGISSMHWIVQEPTKKNK